MKQKIIFFAFSLLLFSAAWADPPARVGRISYIEGNVSLLANSAEHAENDNENAWLPAQLNYPVIAGAALWADRDARFELEVGAAEIRADHDTEIDVVQLDADAAQLRVDRGVANVHIRALHSDRFIIVTPYGDADLVKPGSYHIEVDDSDSNAPSRVQITALEGQANIKSPRGTLEILSGESAVIEGDPVDVNLQEGEPTDFDNWALTRERREQAITANNYVSPEMTGYEDLDEAGRWTVDDDYGAVWYPAVAADWEPYRYGHWVFVEPWGWTWMDDAPWGFAPFHYGRWVHARGRWGWCPGERVARPVYAPALVAFVGGAGWHVGVAAGSRPIGWVPLGPHEIYRPYYRTSVNYVRNINVNYVDKRIVNKITINDAHENHFRNRDAMTVVTHETFTNGRPVHNQVVHVPHDDIARAQPLHDVSQLKPNNAATLHRTPIPRIPVMQPNPREMNTHVEPARERANNYSVPHDSVRHDDMRNDDIRNDRQRRGPPAQNMNTPAPQNVNRQAPPQEIHREAPVVHMPPLQHHWEQHVPPQAPSAPPAAPQHPVQNTQIHPTSQGWQRQPLPHEAMPQRQQPVQQREQPQHQQSAPQREPINHSQRRDDDRH